jgi:hypothetical protein
MLSIKIMTKMVTLQTYIKKLKWQKIQIMILMSKHYKGIEEVKGNDIEILDLNRLTPVCDYFVICNGNSNTS